MVFFVAKGSEKMKKDIIDKIMVGDVPIPSKVIQLWAVAMLNYR